MGETHGSQGVFPILFFHFKKMFLVMFLMLLNTEKRLLILIYDRSILGPPVLIIQTSFLGNHVCSVVLTWQKYLNTLMPMTIPLS